MFPVMRHGGWRLLARMAKLGGTSVHGNVEMKNVLPDAELSIERNGRQVRRICLNEYNVALRAVPIALSSLIRAVATPLRR